LVVMNEDGFPEMSGQPKFNRAVELRIGKDSQGRIPTSFAPNVPLLARQWAWRRSDAQLQQGRALIDARTATVQPLANW